MRTGLGSLREARGLVRSAKELLADERHWTKYVMALDRRGRGVSPGSRRPAPVRWCALGALIECEARLHGRPIMGVAVTEKGLVFAPRDTKRLIVAVCATAVAMEEALRPVDQPPHETRPSDPEQVIRRASETYALALASANDLPETTHATVLVALTFADALLTVALRDRAAETRKRTQDEHAG